MFKGKFKEFLEIESKKGSVRSDGSYISWNYREVEIEKPPKCLDSPFLDEVASEPVILTARELSAIREQIEYLDAEVFRLRRSNFFLKILCLAFLVILLILAARFFGGSLF